MATVIDRVSDDDQRHELLRYVLKLEGADLKDVKKIEAEIKPLVTDQTAFLARVMDARALNAFIGVASDAGAGGLLHPNHCSRVAPSALLTARRGGELFQPPPYSVAQAAASDCPAPVR